MRLRNKFIFFGLMVVLGLLGVGCALTTQRLPLEGARPALMSRPFAWDGLLPPGAMTNPVGIAYHPVTNSLFVIGASGHLAEVSPDGRVLQESVNPGKRFAGAAVDAGSGRLYVLGADRAVLYEWDTHPLRLRAELDIPQPFWRRFLPAPFYRGLAFCPSIGDENKAVMYVAGVRSGRSAGRIWVLHVSRMDPRELTYIREMKLAVQEATDVYCLPENGVLYVMSAPENLLVELLPNGQELSRARFPGQQQQALTRDVTGRLYIVQKDGKIIQLSPLQMLSD